MVVKSLEAGGPVGVVPLPRSSPAGGQSPGQQVSGDFLCLPLTPSAQPLVPPTFSGPPARAASIHYATGSPTMDVPTERAGPRFRRRAACAGLPLVVVLACAGPRPDPVDPAVLMEADRAFARDVAAGGSAEWASWFAEDGAMIQPMVGEVQGHARIQEVMAGLDQPGFSLSWDPLRADIAASGDLGWTTGVYASEVVGLTGDTIRDRGRYVSIWRLQADSSWRVVMDLGNPTATP